MKEVKLVLHLLHHSLSISQNWQQCLTATDLRYLHRQNEQFGRGSLND